MPLYHLRTIDSVSVFLKSVVSAATTSCVIVQAAETLKVTGGYKWDTSTYRKYFDSFADGYNTMYKASEEEEEDQGSSDLLLKQSLPYAIFLIFPVLVVFTLAALKNS